jgi:hypothetical protein
MKYAWIENDKVRDVAHSDPSKIYHADVAVFYDTLVPDDAANGDGWVNGQLVKPEPHPPAPPPARTWSASDVRNGLTLAEKVKWDNDSAPEIVTVKAEIMTPKQQSEVTELLQFLVDSNIISQASMDKIMDGAVITPVQVLP